MAGKRSIQAQQKALPAIAPLFLCLGLVEFPSVGLHFVGEVFVGFYSIAHCIKGVFDDAEGFSVGLVQGCGAEGSVQKVWFVLAVGGSQVQRLIKPSFAEVDKTVKGYVSKRNGVYRPRLIDPERAFLEPGEIAEYRFLHVEFMKL